MILVTGTTGFIGSSLLDALILRYGSDNILALTSQPTDKCNFLLHHDYTFDKNYFFDNGFENIEVIVHAGAFIPKSSLQANDIAQSNSNINNTYKLITSVLPKLKKIIFLSTIDIYGPYDIITEESPVEPVSLYGHSKLYCEKMILAWCKENNIENLILRIGHVYGPGEEKYQKLIPNVIQNIIKNEPIKLYGSGRDIRSFIYISDVIQAIVNSVELSTKGEIINIVGEEKISIYDLIHKIIKLSGKDVPVDHVKTEIQPRNLIFNNDKLKKTLHTPIVSFDEGLENEWNYFNRL